MKDLISFKTATLAKKKGFVDGSGNYYYGGHMWNEGDDVRRITQSSVRNDSDNIFDDVCEAPTQSCLQSWLREKHGIEAWAFPILIGSEEKIVYSFEHIMQDKVNYKAHVEGNYGSFEEALEVALQIALESIE